MAGDVVDHLDLADPDDGAWRHPGDRHGDLLHGALVVAAVADRRDLTDGTAGEYMTSAPATVELETPLADVARTMLADGVRHLPVVVGGEVIGMVSARDLLELESATTA